MFCSSASIDRSRNDSSYVRNCIQVSPLSIVLVHHELNSFHHSSYSIKILLSLSLSPLLSVNTHAPLKNLKNVFVKWAIMKIVHNRAFDFRFFSNLRTFFLHVDLDLSVREIEILKERERERERFSYQLSFRIVQNVHNCIKNFHKHTFCVEREREIVRRKNVKKTLESKIFKYRDEYERR